MTVQLEMTTFGSEVGVGTEEGVGTVKVQQMCLQLELVWTWARNKSQLEVLSSLTHPSSSSDVLSSCSQQKTPQPLL